MRCPYCSAPDSKVVNSRPGDEGGAIRRRRECLSCGRRFTTYERAQLEPLMVLKRGGVRQAFNPDKLLRGLTLATEKRPVRLLFNRAPASGKLRAGMERDIAAAGHPVMSAALGNRIGFAAAFAQGLGVLELAPNTIAGQEMRAIHEELLGYLT